MVCKNFAYPELMRFFEEISAIPRPSYHEERIADYLVAFAEQRGLSYYRDAIGNVLIDLPATPDCVGAETVLLQGHVDMVCEKNEGVEHDFMSDPLKLYEADGWLRAKGTTLGADNGVAVAVMLALLDGAAPSHPALQCLFTVSEEVGLDGAKAFDYSRVSARRMINMDSADESLIIVGCAGGLRSRLSLPITWEQNDAPAYTLKISGLAGGHSGEDIHKSRANADKLMGRILYELERRLSDLRLVSFEGGSKDNAIVREAQATVTTTDSSIVRFAEESARAIGTELVADDRAFSLSIVPVTAERRMVAASSDAVIFLAATVPNGVFATNPALSGLVEFSRNLGIVETTEDAVNFTFSSRSARDSQIDWSAAELDLYAKQLGATVKHYNRYPGWSFAEQSALREEYVEAYRKLYGNEPHLEVIHAGLECGFIKQAVPDMDIISCGPIVLDLHSPDEALHLASFERFFAVILAFLDSRKTEA